jgi:hypothetical protein
MKLLLESWREFLTEDWRDTSWEDDDEKIMIGDVFKIIGSTCEEGRTCEEMRASVLKSMLKKKPIKVKHLDPDKLKTADISHPLIVVVDNGEYQFIMDGNHRFTVAEQNDAIVKVKELYMDEYDQLFRDAK